MEVSKKLWRLFGDIKDKKTRNWILSIGNDIHEKCIRKALESAGQKKIKFESIDKNMIWSIPRHCKYCGVVG